MRQSLACALLYAAFAPLHDLAQQPPFKSGISIVEIDAAVVGKGGSIEGLGLSDFAVQDNRQKVILRDGSEDDSALDMIFLFELSKPMLRNLPPMRVAAEMAMAELRAGDRVAVMSFNQATQVEEPLTADLNAAKLRIRNGLSGAAFRGAPFILPAAEASAKYFASLPEPHGRRVVLMFTGDAGSGAHASGGMGVAKEFWDAEASLSALVIPDIVTRRTRDYNPAYFALWARLGVNLFDIIDDVAEDSGGEVVYAGDAGTIHGDPHPNTALRQMIQRMRRRYRLYYDMPAGRPGHRRQIQIDLSPAARALHPDARIISRKGYVIPKRIP